MQQTLWLIPLYHLYSILFHSSVQQSLFYSILCHNLFYSILLYYIVYSIVFCAIFYSILFYSAMYCTAYCSILFNCIALYFQDIPQPHCYHPYRLPMTPEVAIIIILHTRQQAPGLHPCSLSVNACAVSVMTNTRAWSLITTPLHTHCSIFSSVWTGRQLRSCGWCIVCLQVCVVFQA